MDSKQVSSDAQHLWSFETTAKFGVELIDLSRDGIQRILKGHAAYAAGQIRTPMQRSE